MKDTNKKHDNDREEVVSENELDFQSLGLINALLESLSIDRSKVSYNLDEVEIHLLPSEVRDVCIRAKEADNLAFDYLRCLSVVDYDDHFQIVYHLYSVSKNHRMTIKTSAQKDNPIFESVTSVWRGADWYEREGRQRSP
mgnify:CR=1 FL=1